jgi:hypothetical protein
MKYKLLGALGTFFANGALALAQTPHAALGTPTPAAATAQAPVIVPAVDAVTAPAVASEQAATTIYAPDIVFDGGVRVPRFWFSADYLHLWVQDGPIPLPLVATGPDNVPLSGIAGQPGTVNLFPSGGRLDYGNLSGWRVVGGMWLDDAGCLGIEAGGFGTERGSASFRLAGDANGQPFFGRPFINARTGQPNLYFVSQNFSDPALDANLTGALAIESTTQIWGWEVSGVTTLQREKCFKSEAIFGFRAIELDESLRFAESLRSLGGAGGGFFLGAPVDPSESLATFDSFETRGSFLLGLAGKVAFGINRQESIINGGSARIDAAGNVVATAPGGVYALSSNIGRRSHDDFAIIPELGVNLGYEVADSIILRVGYNFLYLSSVARAGQQIDPQINPALVPTDSRFGGGGPERPLIPLKDNDFWAHGLNFGVEVRY